MRWGFLIDSSLRTSGTSLWVGAPPLAVADSSPRSPSGATADALPANVAELTRRARDHYDRARAAQRSDDWATYGAEMRKLGEVLRQLEQRR